MRQDEKKSQRQKEEKGQRNRGDGLGFNSINSSKPDSHVIIKTIQFLIDVRDEERGDEEEERQKNANRTKERVNDKEGMDRKRYRLQMSCRKMQKCCALPGLLYVSKKQSRWPMLNQKKGSYYEEFLDSAIKN